MSKRHEKKFSKLHNSRPFGEHTVTNLSDHQLSALKNRALSRSLDFCLVSHRYHSYDVMTSFELLYNDINLGESKTAEICDVKSNLINIYDNE